MIKTGSFAAVAEEHVTEANKVLGNQLRDAEHVVASSSLTARQEGNLCALSAAVAFTSYELMLATAPPKKWFRVTLCGL